MNNDVIVGLTILSNFLCSALALWFAIYLMSRSRANYLTFRAVVALIALALFYWSALWSMLGAQVNAAPVRSMAIMIALTATHDLTHYLLPESLRKKTYWLARAIVMGNVVMMALIFYLVDDSGCSPLYVCPVTRLFPDGVIGLFDTVILLAVLVNLWFIWKGARTFNRGFFFGVLFGIGSVGYGVFGTAFGENLPRFAANGLVLIALSLWGYSVARHQLLVERRFSLYDLPVLVLTAVGIAAFYILVTWQLGLDLIEILLLALLAVFTHAIYDFVRELLERVFRQQEHTLRRQVRELSRTNPPGTSLKPLLRRTLAILCHNLGASSGFVAIRKNGQYVVETSFHSFPIGTRLPIESKFLEEISPASGMLAKQVAWLAPAVQGGSMIAVVGLGPPKGPQIYSEEDLHWLEEITEEIGALVYLRHLTLGQQEPGFDPAGERSEFQSEDQTESELISSLTYRPNNEQIKDVEEGLRNLHDYSRLGRSPLASWMGVNGDTSLKRGKQVQEKISDALELLRPPGKLPSEPYPRAWYSYTILHDAYVLNTPAKEIIAKLYISEGTYFRLRRKALRVLTRALLETIPNN